MILAPSILSADFLNLEKVVRMLNESEADYIHLDIMDGVFVPNITFGFPFIEKIAEIAGKPLDVHLMITDPDRYISRFISSGASLLSVHYETCKNLHRTIQAIKDHKAKAGVVLNPHSPVSLLEEIISAVDFVLLMSVNPGFGGQTFIPGTLNKISRLKDLIVKSGSGALIEVDGGVDESNAGKLLAAGADILVAGNAVFNSDDPAGKIRALKSIR